MMFAKHVKSFLPKLHTQFVPTNTSRQVLMLNMSVFNLNGVCWTVCCLTYTTFSTVHVHSFHKKYIFVYTAFTISNNRAVAGTSVWMDAFVTKWLSSVHKIQAILIIIIQRSHRNVYMCFTSRCAFALLQPGADTLVHSAVPVVFAAARPSVLSAATPTPCRPHPGGWRYCRKL